MSVLRSKFTAHLELKGYSQRTIGSYVQCMACFVRFHNKPPLKMTNEDIRAYLLHLKKVRKLEPKTINLHRYSIKSFYDYFLPKSGLLDGTSRMKEPLKVPEILSREEVERIIVKANPLKIKALAVVLYSSGIRLKECGFLKVGNIDSKRMVIRVEQGKGNKDRYAILSRRALEILRDYYRQYHPQYWLFESNIKDKPLSLRRIQQYIQRAAWQAGIEKHVTPHILRHSFATHLLESGKPLKAIQELLGHAQITTTTVYTHVSAALLNEVGSPFDSPINRKEISNG